MPYIYLCTATSERIPLIGTAFMCEFWDLSGSFAQHDHALNKVCSLAYALTSLHRGILVMLHHPTRPLPTSNYPNSKQTEKLMIRYFRLSPYHTNVSIHRDPSIVHPASIHQLISPLAGVSLTHCQLLSIIYANCCSDNPWALELHVSVM